MQFSDYQNICVYFAVAALRIQFLSIAQNTGSRAGVIKVPSVSLRGNYYFEICKKVSAATSILPNSKSFPRKLEDMATAEYGNELHMYEGTISGVGGPIHSVQNANGAI